MFRADLQTQTPQWPQKHTGFIFIPLLINVSLEIFFFFCIHFENKHLYHSIKKKGKLLFLHHYGTPKALFTYLRVQAQANNMQLPMFACLLNKFDSHPPEETISVYIKIVFHFDHFQMRDDADITECFNVRNDPIYSMFCCLSSSLLFLQDHSQSKSVGFNGSTFCDRKLQ